MKTKQLAEDFEIQMLSEKIEETISQSVIPPSIDVDVTCDECCETFETTVDLSHLDLGMDYFKEEIERTIREYLKFHDLEIVKKEKTND
jgi:hypothetical protein